MKLSIYIYLFTCEFEKKRNCNKLVHMNHVFRLSANTQLQSLISLTRSELFLVLFHSFYCSYYFFYLFNTATLYLFCTGIPVSASRLWLTDINICELVHLTINSNSKSLVTWLCYCHLVFYSTMRVGNVVDLFTSRSLIPQGGGGNRGDSWMYFNFTRELGTVWKYCGKCLHSKRSLINV